MKYLIDTGNIEKIKECIDTYPIAGVTTNPSILKKEGDIPFFEHFMEVRRIIGTDKSLHIQVTGQNVYDMLKESNAILNRIDSGIYIKVPSTSEGFKVMKQLKKDGIHVTATMIYNKTQGYMASILGVDYIAMYCNRMSAADIDFRNTIGELRQDIERSGSKSKILGASFHSIEQINGAISSGAHSVTVDPAMLCAAVDNDLVRGASAAFYNDWTEIRGGKLICAL